LRNNRSLTAALAGITAAVVGVIANLALYFAIHTLFAGTSQVSFGPVGFELPLWETLQIPALAITLLAGVLLFWRRLGALPTLGICTGAGILVYVLQTALTGLT
jgi:chromate transporter